MRRANNAAARRATHAACSPWGAVGGAGPRPKPREKRAPDQNDSFGSHLVAFWGAVTGRMGDIRDFCYGSLAASFPSGT
jgi:hypothetical protein